MTSKRIAVLGAAFDPPTKGHQDVISQCLERFDEVWLVPAYCHAFDKKMSDYPFRLKLVELFIEDLANPNVKLKACEDNIHTQGIVYSIDLMRHLKTEYPKAHLSLIIGPDNEKAFHRFKDADILKKDFSPFVVEERHPIRSSLVRRKLKAGDNIDALITDSVKAFILDGKYYL